MDLDLTTINRYPIIKTMSIDSVLSRIRLPPRAKKITIGTQAGALWVTNDGAAVEGQAPPAHKCFIPNFGYFQMVLGRGSDKTNDIYVSLQTGTGDIHIVLEDE